MDTIIKKGVIIYEIYINSLHIIKFIYNGLYI